MSDVSELYLTIPAPCSVKAFEERWGPLSYDEEQTDLVPVFLRDLRHLIQVCRDERK